ncbi:MAG TPA: hypothetical protein VJ456_02240 [Acidimicrobiia bacterium]|nr:hypothetical protein [Acidimicrobiia bacterium]
MSSFEALVLDWARAACADWGYPDVGAEWLSAVAARLPQGLGSAVADAVERGVIVVVDGHRFTLAGLDAGKGPYAFFSRSNRRVPAPNWEYFVQAAEYGRVTAAVGDRGYRVDFEDDLMDVSVYDEERLVWCIEVKEKARSLDSLLTGIRRYGRALDRNAPDRGDDALRKAKYLARRRPPYFSLVAIGCRLDFSVSYDGDRFSLVDDLVPFG